MQKRLEKHWGSERCSVYTNHYPPTTKSCQELKASQQEDIEKLKAALEDSSTQQDVVLKLPKKHFFMPDNTRILAAK